MTGARVVGNETGMIIVYIMPSGRREPVGRVLWRPGRVREVEWVSLEAWKSEKSGRGMLGFCENGRGG